MGYSLLLFLHICGAGIGLLSGTAAVIFRKGWRWHRNFDRDELLADPRAYFRGV